MGGNGLRHLESGPAGNPRPLQEGAGDFAYPFPFQTFDYQPGTGFGPQDRLGPLQGNADTPV